MREAIGGAWLYYIFVVMIMFIVSFLAIFLNYMTAYRANNHLISVLEQSEGIMPAGIGKGFIIRIATFMPVKIPLVDINLDIPVKNETRTINCYGNGACPPGNVLSSLTTSYGTPKPCAVGW